MQHQPELLRTDEANELLRAVTEPITSHLINNAMYQFMIKYHVKLERPASDFDLRYFLDVLLQIFEDHDVLRRILSGEQVGALYDDEQLKAWTQTTTGDEIV